MDISSRKFICYVCILATIRNKTLITPLLAAASITQVFEDLGVASEIKFVNDVFINGKKVSGTICGGETKGNDYKLEMNFGVNLNTSKEAYEDLPIAASSLLIESGKSEY